MADFFVCGWRSPVDRLCRHLRVGAAMTALLLAACTSRLPDQDLRILEAVPVERLSAALLWQEYQSDPAAAGRKYAGKAITVTGTVVRSGSGAPGDRYVHFAPAGTPGVRAALLDEQAASIFEAVKVSPRVALNCFCEGLSTDVILKSCVAGR